MQIYLILFNSTQRSIIDYAMTTRLSLTSILAVFKVVATKKKKNAAENECVFGGHALSFPNLLVEQNLRHKIFGSKGTLIPTDQKSPQTHLQLQK